MNDIDDLYLILPGFKLDVWKDYNGSGTKLLSYDNSGDYIVYKVPSEINQASSCKLYFKGSEVIKNKADNTSAPTTTEVCSLPDPIKLQIPSILNINKIKGFPHFPGAYLLASGATPIFCCISNLVSTLCMGDRDVYWAVMPGFILIVYNDYYSGIHY